MRANKRPGKLRGILDAISRETITIVPGKAYIKGRDNQARQQGNTLEIVQVGYVYIFKVSTLLRAEDIQAERTRIIKELEEGCLCLDGRTQLISVKPHYKAMVK